MISVSFFLHSYTHTNTHFIIRTKLVWGIKILKLHLIKSFHIARYSVSQQKVLQYHSITELYKIIRCCGYNKLMSTFYSSSVAPINCDKQEREKKTNQSRTVKSCIAARQARHGLPTSLMECTTVEWNFNQGHICQCPLAFHVLKASVVLFVLYCDQDECRGGGGLPLVDMSWFTVHLQCQMYRLQRPGGKYAPQPARDEWGNDFW